MRILSVLFCLVVASALNAGVLRGFTGLGKGGVVAVSSGTTYEFNETFEGSIPDSQSVVGYDNSGWTSSSNLIVPHTTTGAIQGTYSCVFGLPGRNITHDFVTSSGSVCILQRYKRPSTWTTASKIMEIKDASNNILAHLDTGSAGATLKITCGTVASSNVGSFSVNVAYYIGVEYTKGTGSNAVLTLYASSDGTKTQLAQITTGDSTANAVRVSFYASTDGIIDVIAMDGTHLIGPIL